MRILLLSLFIIFNVQAQEEETEALRAMRLSCEKHKVALGCHNYANMLLRQNQSENADKYFEMGCKLEHTPSCSKQTWDIAESSTSHAPASVPQTDLSAEEKPDPAELDFSGEL